MMWPVPTLCIQWFLSYEELKCNYFWPRGGWHSVTCCICGWSLENRCLYHGDRNFQLPAHCRVIHACRRSCCVDTTNIWWMMGWMLPDLWVGVRIKTEGNLLLHSAWQNSSLIGLLPTKQQEWEQTVNRAGNPATRTPGVKPVYCV